MATFDEIKVEYEDGMSPAICNPQTIIIGELITMVEELEAQVDARQWKTPEDRYTAGILIVEVDLKNGDVCRGMVIQDDEDYNELLIADQYMDVWTDFRWPDIDRYYVLPSPEAAIKGDDHE